MTMNLAHLLRYYSLAVSTLVLLLKPSTTDASDLVGCYEKMPDVVEVPLKEGDKTVSHCVDACSTRSHSAGYAAMGPESRCYCVSETLGGKPFESYQKQSAMRCNKNCQYDAKNKCGGSSANPKKTFISVYKTKGVSVSDEKRLIKDLLDRYDKIGIYGRPVVNRSMTINVQYGMGLIQILDLDEKDQVLTTNNWCRFKWTDILLKWDPTKYGNVFTVRVPAEKIWKPDIVLYNYADERLREHREAMAVVQYTGEVLWIPMAIFKSVCQIDITHFPFDEQTCLMKFGSWTYDGYHLDINFFDGKKQFELNDYMKSHEWEILTAQAEKNIKRYPCCEEPYPDLTFTLKIRRKVAFYNYILILPCVLLSTLTLVLFWLPPESPAKMVLGMNIFVAFFLLLLLLADSTPPAASKIPLIGAYYCLNMIMITLSTFLSVIVINLYFRGDRKNRVPKWLKLIMIDGIARILCMKSEMSARQQSQKPPQSRVPTSNAKKKSNVYKDMQLMNHSQAAAGGGNMPQVEFPTTPERSPLAHHASAENDIKEIRGVLKTLLKRLTDKDAIGRIAMEWRLVALVLDRLFFFMYLLMIIISLATIFPKTPSAPGVEGGGH